MDEFIFHNTDEERLLILRSLRDDFGQLYHYGNDVDGMYHDEIFGRIERDLSFFEKLHIYKDCLRKEAAAAKSRYDEHFGKAKMYVTHYLTVMNMSIERGEQPESIVDFYGLAYPIHVPEFATAESLFTFAEQLFAGDALRIGRGGKYFSNPGIGSVKVWIERFREVWSEADNASNAKQGDVENVDEMRCEADKVIAEVATTLLHDMEALPFDEKQRFFSRLHIEMQAPPLLPAHNAAANTDTQAAPAKPRRRHKTPICNVNQLQFDLFFPTAN